MIFTLDDDEVYILSPKGSNLTRGNSFEFTLAVVNFWKRVSCSSGNICWRSDFLVSVAGHGQLIAARRLDGDPRSGPQESSGFQIESLNANLSACGFLKMVGIKINKQILVDCEGKYSS